MRNLINLAIYQLVWFCAVAYGNAGALSGLLLVVHLALSRNRRGDLLLMLLLLASGTALDTLLQLAGVLAFSPPPLLIPLWLAVIWLALATLPLNGLSWMIDRPFTCIGFGLVGGPLAYWAGTRLGGATFPFSSLYSLSLLALVWALYWPLVMVIAGRLRNRRETPKRNAT